MGDPAGIIDGCKIVSVACSTENLVWCVDECHGVHAREAVYPELPVGVSWVSVSGISAVSISVSRQTVWVLSPSGQIYRRTGISPTNWVGDAWESIPAPTGQAVALSVGLCDSAWSLDRSGMLHQLATRRLVLRGGGDVERLDSTDSIGDDWAVVM